MAGTETGRAPDWISLGRKLQGHDHSGKGGFREEEVGRQQGRKEQEVQSRGRRAQGGGRGSGRAAEEGGQRVNLSVRRGQVTPGDRSEVGRSRRLAAASMWGGERRDGQRTKGRCGHGRPEQSTKGPSSRPAAGGSPQNLVHCSLISLWTVTMKDGKCRRLQIARVHSKKKYGKYIS